MRWTGWSEFGCVPMSADLVPLGEGRSPGLHLSDVIHKMKKGIGESVVSPEGDQPLVRMQEGFLWETALEYVAAGLPLDQALEIAFKRYMVCVRAGVVKQIAVEKDGIHMTPDGFDPVSGGLESYKVTRKTLRNALTQEGFETNFWSWVTQEKSYCYAVGVDTVTWFVLWQAGDYSKGPGSGPKMLKATATFTPEELVANWSVVLKHAEGLR